MRIFFIIILFYLTMFGFCFSQTDIPLVRPNIEQYCFDFTEVLHYNLIHEINVQGEGLKRHFDIDFVVVIIPSLNGKDIVEYSADLFSRWEIGKDTAGKKGLLILIAQKEQQIKIEVGYDLEEAYTDLYIAQVEREMLKEFLEQADWERGFLATIENLVERTCRMFKKGVDVREITSRGGGEYYSGGAGAKNVFDFGAALNKPIPATPQELREYFSSQPTPELAFERYMEFNAKDMSDYTVDLFSDLSKEFFSHWRTSSGQRRSEAEASSGQPYIVMTRGKYAVVMFPCNGDIEEIICHCPYFLIHTKKGWQIDIHTMGRSIIFGGPTWHFLSISHPYMFAFKDYLIKTNRLYPLEGQTAFLGINYLRYNDKAKGYEINPEWGSPAEAAGILENDILISIAGVTITEAYQDWQMMKKYNPGDTVEVVISRGGKKEKIKVILEEVKSFLDDFPWTRNEGDAWLGLYLGYSQPYERDIVESYLAVVSVAEGSPGQRAGFKDGDLIIYIPEMENDYACMSDFINILKQTKPGDKLKFKVLRNLSEKLEITVEVGEYSQGKEGL